MTVFAPNSPQLRAVQASHTKIWSEHPVQASRQVCKPQHLTLHRIAIPMEPLPQSCLTCSKPWFWLHRQTCRTACPASSAYPACGVVEGALPGGVSKTLALRPAEGVRWKVWCGWPGRPSAELGLNTVVLTRRGSHCNQAASPLSTGEMRNVFELQLFHLL
jgi:hypothetical protein